MRQPPLNPDHASSPVVGLLECWPPGMLAAHRHTRHQILYAIRAAVHVSTSRGDWLLPPSRAMWISAGTEHSLLVKRPTQTSVLYIDPAVWSAPGSEHCRVMNVSPLVRELILACAELPWQHADAAQIRLGQVLLDQLQALEQAPVELPLPCDPRALRIVDMLRQNPASREPLALLAKRVGASARTIERLFVRETGLSFGMWRHRQRLIFALERLAYGETVTNVAVDSGYESASSFVVAFRALFGTTPARYFKPR